MNYKKHKVYNENDIKILQGVYSPDQELEIEETGEIVTLPIIRMNVDWNNFDPITLIYKK